MAKTNKFDNGDPRCEHFHSGDCLVIPDDWEQCCNGVERCPEARPIVKLSEILLKKARDVLYMLEKDEDKGITKEEKKLVEEIDAYFGVLTPEHQGKRTFKLTEK